VSLPGFNHWESGQQSYPRWPHSQFDALCEDVERRLPFSITGARQYLIRWAEERDTGD